MKRLIGFTMLAALPLAALCCENADVPDDQPTLPTKPSTGGTRPTNEPPLVLPFGGSKGEGGEGHTVDDPGTNKPVFPDNVEFSYESRTDVPGSCGNVMGEATTVRRPMDIVFVIDNSSSMDDEIDEVEKSVYAEFSNIISASNIDYRVIMISRYGENHGSIVGESDHPICIPPPLGATSCTDATHQPLQNASRFFHYSADVESQDALCLLLSSFQQPDEFDNSNTKDDGPGSSVYRSWTTLAPDGWSAWLRPDSFKTFVVITDDDVMCNLSEFGGPNVSLNDGNNAGSGQSAASTFDARLLALPGAPFGSSSDRNYVWHSIVGMAGKGGLKAWEPSDPVNTALCGKGAVGPGTGYQALSRLTGGLRYPICPTASGTTNFDPIFNAIAEGVIAHADVPCAFELPEVTGVIDPRTIKVDYVPGGGEPSRALSRASGADCASGDYYLDDAERPTALTLCSSSCRAIQEDDKAKIKVDFGCLGS